MATTLNDIARELNVSPQTVARVLAGTNKENRPSSIARANRIRQLAREMNYRPNAAARSMANRSTRNIGVLVAASHYQPFSANSVYFSILGVNDVLEAEGYITSVVRVDEIKHQLDIRSRAAHEIVFDGVIAVGSIPVVLREPIESLFERVVWLDTNIDLPQRCMTRNELQVGRMAGERLVEAGYRKAVWVGRVAHSPRDHHSHEARHVGLKQVVDAAAVPLEEVESANREIEDIEEDLTGRLGPDVAVVASESTCVMYVQRTAMQSRRLIGEDLGLVACDATPNITSVWPELTHIKYDRYEAGRSAARMILDQITDPERKCFSQQLPLEWVKGSTLGQPGGE